MANIICRLCLKICVADIQINDAFSVHTISQVPNVLVYDVGIKSYTVKYIGFSFRSEVHSTCSVSCILLYMISLERNGKIVVSFHYQYISQGVITVVEITQKMNSDQVCNLAKN